MSIRRIKRKIEALPDVKRIPKYWKNMQAAKESRHDEPVWKKNPIKILAEAPASIRVFRKLPKKLRHKMFEKRGVKKEFNPRHLVTYQPMISGAAVLHFVANADLVKRKKAYVIGTEEGPCIWNGNHRAVSALLEGKKFTAVYLDLTK